MSSKHVLILTSRGHARPIMFEAEEKYGLTPFHSPCGVYDKLRWTKNEALDLQRTLTNITCPECIAWVTGLILKEAG